MISTIDKIRQQCKQDLRSAVQDERKVKQEYVLFYYDLDDRLHQTMVKW